MKRSSIRCWVAMLALCPFASYAREQHLRYESGQTIWVFAFDDRRISVREMRRLVVFSPYGLHIPGTPFQVVSSDDGVNGAEIFDKLLVAPGLEDCFETPCRHNPEVVDAAFLRDAAINLSRGADQVQVLRKERVPAVLGPAKVYLLANLERSLEMERARYEYYKSGNLAPMERILCQACKCRAAEQELLRQLRTETDGEKRRLLSWHDWNNQVLGCERSGNRAIYPIDAWRRFLKEYGITEQRTEEPVD